MSFRNGKIRVLFVGSVLLIAQTVPAFAEKVTLMCTLGGDYIKMYFTFDLNEKTVTDPRGAGTYAIREGTYAIQVTEDEIFWRINPQDSARYNRRTAQLRLYDRNGDEGVTPCIRAPRGPL